MPDFYSTFAPAEQREFDSLKTSTEIAEFLRGLHGPTPDQQERDAAGRFVGGAPDAAKAAADKAAADAAAPREFKQVVKINGRDFTFTGESAESVELQVRSAKATAQRLQQADTHERRNVAADILKQQELEERFRAGAINAEQYLQASGLIEKVVDERLTAEGFDARKAAHEQFEQSWIEAASEFVTTAEGRDWPGGEKNKELLALKIVEMNLVDSDDKVAACAQAYAALKSKGMLFDGDHEAKDLEKLAIESGASPQEILQAWKDRQPDVKSGDATAANEAFIQTFQNGRSSGIFGK